MRVCILGSGLSSLTLAKSLVNQKINVDVLCSKKKYSVNKTRTIGISKSNVEFFNEKIINIEKIIYKLKKIEIYSDNLEKKKLINFRNKNDYLFSIVKNHKLQEILEKNLSNNKYYRKTNFIKKINAKNNVVFSIKFFDLSDVIYVRGINFKSEFHLL